MILRKPYGFLIKHFRLIHLIISGILIILISKYRDIYSFINSCISNPLNKYNALSYVNYGIYIWFIILFILFLIVYLLLRYKDKPRNLYIFCTIGYIIVAFIISSTYNYLGNIVNESIVQSTIRLYKDVLLIMMLYQYLIIIVMVIRGIGFDIKKFDFNKDMQELNLTDADQEEIIVGTNVDTTNVRRFFRRQLRELGYFFKEYRVIILGIFAIIIVILGWKGYNFYTDKFKVYNEGDWVGSNNYISVIDSYYSIVDNKNYVIIKFSAYNRGVNDRINTGNMVLMVGNERYTPNKNICANFNKLGNCYKKQYINSKENNYILTYEVNKFKLNKSYLLYTESFNKNLKIKLKMGSYGE